MKQGSRMIFENDIEGVREPQRAHSDDCVARAAENRVDEKNQKHRDVSPEHDTRVARAEFHDFFARTHEAQNVGRKESQQHAQTGGQGHAKHQNLPGGMCGRRWVFLTDPARDDGRSGK
jgi:hypothetical protein